MNIKVNSIIFVCLILALYIGAGYTQSGWQYWLLSVLLACITIGFFLTLISLRKIKVKKIIPSKMTVGKYSAIKIVIENTSIFTKRYLNIYSQLIDTGEKDKNTYDNFTRARDLKINLITIFNTDLIMMFKRVDYSFTQFIKKIPGKSNLTINNSFLPTKRGVFKTGSVDIIDCCPFGIFERVKKFKTKEEVVIYPKIINVRSGWIKRIAQKPTFTETSRVMTPSSIASMTRSLREYQPGDPLKYIHWPSSAKANKLLVKEFEIESKGSVIIALDSSNKYTSELYYELAVITASSLLNICHASNLTTRFVTQEDAYKGYEYTITDEFESQLEVLARVQPVKSNTIYSIIETESKKQSKYKPTIILITHNNSSKPAQTIDVVTISVNHNPDLSANYTICSEKDLRHI